MKTLQWQGGTLVVSTLVFLLIAALLLLIDVSPPKDLALVEGRVVNLTPIETGRISSVAIPWAGARPATHARPRGSAGP